MINGCVDQAVHKIPAVGHALFQSSQSALNRNCRANAGKGLTLNPQRMPKKDHSTVEHSRQCEPRGLQSGAGAIMWVAPGIVVDIDTGKQACAAQRLGQFSQHLVHFTLGLVRAWPTAIEIGLA